MEATTLANLLADPTSAQPAIIVEASGVTFHAVHVEGTRHVLEAAARAGVERFVHMSAVGARAWW